MGGEEVTEEEREGESRAGNATRLLVGGIGGVGCLNSNAHPRTAILAFLDEGGVEGPYFSVGAGGVEPGINSGDLFSGEPSPREYERSFEGEEVRGGNCVGVGDWAGRERVVYWARESMGELSRDVAGDVAEVACRGFHCC